MVSICKIITDHTNLYYFTHYYNLKEYIYFNNNNNYQFIHTRL